MIFINKCPFCGSNDLTIIESILEGTYYVYCRECSAQGPIDKAKEEAVKKWNKARRK